MTTTINFLFKHSEDIRSLINTVYNNYLTFKPEEVEITDEFSNDLFSFSDFSLEVLNNYETPSINFLDNKGNKITVTDTAYKSGPISIYWHIEKNESIERLLNLTFMDSFTCGYMYLDDFVFWQSQKELSVYKTFSKPVGNKKLIIDPIFDRKIIDISKNPGRRVAVQNAWLQASYIMIFGKYLLEHTSEDRLMSFQGAEEIKKLPSGCIYIKLYNDIYKSDDSASLKVMENFRDWIRMDELTKKLK